MIRVRILISGNVIGVSFRIFVKENADNLLINGWVKNTIEGKLEAVLEGKKEKIEELIDLCKIGPVAAKVSDIVVKDEKYTGEFEDFSILF